MFVSMSMPTCNLQLVTCNLQPVKKPGNLPAAGFTSVKNILLINQNRIIDAISGSMQ